MFWIFLKWPLSDKNKAFRNIARPIAVAVWSLAWVCSCSPAGIMGSNPDMGMDVYLL
jgi:hypothetical protein